MVSRERLIQFLEKSPGSAVGEQIKVSQGFTTDEEVLEWLKKNEGTPVLQATRNVTPDTAALDAVAAILYVDYDIEASQQYTEVRLRRWEDTLDQHLDIRGTYEVHPETRVITLCIADLEDVLHEANEEWRQSVDPCIALNELVDSSAEAVEELGSTMGNKIEYVMDCIQELVPEGYTLETV